MNIKKQPIIGIIGGTGKMGQWFKHFFEENHLKVLIYGRSTPLTIKDVAKESDIVIISVPISETQKVIKEIISLMPKSSLLTDITSFKVMPLETMKEAQCASLGMHPLFGPSATISQGLKIVFCEQSKNKYVDFLKDLFKKNNIEIIKLSSEEHDYQMAYIQAFTHAINLLYSKIIFEQKNMLSNKLLTPIFALQSLVMGRVLYQDLKLIRDIQFYNPYFLPVLEAFLEEGKKLEKIIEKEDEKGFNEMFKEEKKIARNFSNFSALKTNKILQQLNEVSLTLPTKVKPIEDYKGAKIAYLGPVATYSHQAANELFPQNTHQKISCDTLFDVFKKVSENEADFGVIPAENSTEGTIHATIDYLVHFSLFVAGSFELPIHHQLLSEEKSLKKITTVVSHPQALAQCENWIKKNLPNAHTISSISTTSNIEKSKKGFGFISSRTASIEYGIPILAQNIEDNHNNSTRFYVITKHPMKIKRLHATNTLLFLTIYNRVGILRDILDVLAKKQINLTKLESRPSQEKIWDYYFFIEVEKENDDPILIEALKELEAYCPVIRVLGQT